MERLTYRDKKGKAHIFCKQMCADAENCTDSYSVDLCQRFSAFRKLAEYEDLEEQGLLLHLPFPLETECIYVVEKYGMKIYKLDAAKIEISKMQISKNILYEIDGFELLFQDFGEIAFLTEEEAEAKLKELEEIHEGE